MDDTRWVARGSGGWRCGGSGRSLRRRGRGAFERRARRGGFRRWLRLERLELDREAVAHQAAWAVPGSEHRHARREDEPAAGAPDRRTAEPRNRDRAEFTASHAGRPPRAGSSCTPVVRQGRAGNADRPTHHGLSAGLHRSKQRASGSAHGCEATIVPYRPGRRERTHVRLASQALTSRPRALGRNHTRRGAEG